MAVNMRLGSGAEFWNPCHRVHDLKLTAATANQLLPSDWPLPATCLGKVWSPNTSRCTVGSGGKACFNDNALAPHANADYLPKAC